MTERMKIGVFTEFLPYLPARDGFRVYEANLLRELSHRHELHLISLVRDEDFPHKSWSEDIFASAAFVDAHANSVAHRIANSVSIYGTGKALHYRSEVVDLISHKAKSENWDLLYVAGNFIAGLIPDSLDIPRVLALHDAHTLRFQQKAESATSALERIKYKALQRLQGRYERIQFNKFNACTFVSQKDLDEQRKLGVSVELKVIPLAVDTDYFAPANTSAPSSTLVFHGNLSYEPNVEAVLEFANFILPELKKELSDIEFLVVGSSPSQAIKDLGTTGAIRLVANPDDLRPFIQSSTVYVCAMRLGTGMKTKLLEAMAMEKPIVAYPEAVGGIDFANDAHFLVANDRQVFSNFVRMLLNSPEKRAAIGKSARSLVLEHYSWNSRAHELEELLVQCRGQFPPR
jgi:glycosyltransferase involved in cell wall biosynthesis